jgi:uncharacterized protein YkwD
MKLFSAFLMLSLCLAAPAETTSINSGKETSIEQLIIQYTNSERSNYGLSLVVPDSRLMNAARHQAKNMADRDTLSHVLNYADLPSVQDRLSYYGYPFWTYGENIAYGRDTAHEVVADWMNSPGHRQNVLNSAFTEIGVGVAYYPAQGYLRPYYCQVFGAPATATSALAKLMTTH